MNNERRRLLTAEAFATKLNECGVLYAVVNGLYGYPETIGRDIDMVILPEDIPRAISVAQAVGSEFEWDYMFIRWSHYGVWQLFYATLTATEMCWLEIDLMTHRKGLKCGGVPIYDSKKIIAESACKFVGPFRVSSVGQYVKSYVRPLYYQDTTRFERRYPLQPPPTKDTEDHVENLLGKRLYADYMKLFQDGAKRDLSRVSHRIRMQVNIRYATRHPFRFIVNATWSRIIRPVLLYFRNNGVVIAIVGPDGVGKSSTIKKFMEYSNGLFDIRVRHWRPGVLKNPGEFAGRKHCSDTPPNHTPTRRWQHWPRLVYYGIDYIIGHFLKDRFLPQAVVQLVIYDRWAPDMAVDPQRYRLSSPKGVRLLCKLIPKPDAVIFLHDSPERILDRKNELSDGEMRRQISEWQKMLRSKVVDSRIQAGDSVEETARRLAVEILEVVSRRYSIASSFGDGAHDGISSTATTSSRAKINVEDQ